MRCLNTNLHASNHYLLLREFERYCNVCEFLENGGDIELILRSIVYAEIHYRGVLVMEEEYDEEATV